ncbi:MAG TPA: hypothetical protein VMY37_28830 [Thermoguttaceae bacterium]|nr:hypothetical protein [Thermoguttaceae bacterium]
MDIWQETHDRVRAEEIARKQARDELKRQKSRGERFWDFLNSQVGGWLLSTVLVGAVVLLYTSCTEHLQGERERRTSAEKLAAELEFRIQCAFAELSGDPARARSAFDGEILPGHLYPEFADWKLVTVLWELARVSDDEETRTHVKDQISAFSEIAVRPGGALEEEQLRETLSSLRSTIVRLFPGLPVFAGRDASTLNVFGTVVPAHDIWEL